MVLNLTAVATTSAGYFTMFPGGTSRPTASSINFPKGWTGANMVTVPVGADGTIALYNYGGAAHAVIDVLGWYWKGADEDLGSQMLPLGDAFRAYDSRDENDPFGGSESEDVYMTSGDPEADAQVVRVRPHRDGRRRDEARRPDGLERRGHPAHRLDRQLRARRHRAEHGRRQGGALDAGRRASGSRTRAAARSTSSSTSSASSWRTRRSGCASRRARRRPASSTPARARA